MMKSEILNPERPGRHFESCLRRRSKEIRPPDEFLTLLLLAGDRLRLALAGARIGVRALAADGKALAMTQAAIAGVVHQALDVPRRFAAKVAPRRVVGVQRFADLAAFGVGQVRTAGRR